MVRYSVTAQDNGGRASRWPLFLDPFASAEYQGAVVRNPAVTSPLPVLQWFAQNTAAADTATGTRCSFFYDSEFYDNVYIRIRGQTSRSYPKKSYKVEVNQEHQFRYRPNLSRVSEFDLNSTYTDKAYVRALLAYEHMRDSGLPCPEIFHVQLQQNGAFYSVSMFVENPDKDYLRHQGLADTGALYKGNQSSHAGNFTLLVTNLAGAVTSAVSVVVYRPDNDREGLSDDWERLSNFSTNDPANALMDFDGDSMSNLAEYISGTDPTDPSSYLRIDTTTPPLASLTFLAVSNRTYVVEFTDNLGSMPWTNLATVPARLTNRIEIIPDPGNIPRRYYRLKIP